MGSGIRAPERNGIVTDPIKPSRRDRFKPVELLVMSAIVGVFVGLVVAGSVREIGLGAIFGGVAFIVSLVILATLAITTKPDETERLDIDNQDHGGH
jgi:F0F1-type ATP synthase assembly protein I